MSFKLDKVVPWGRSLGEYRHMFALTEDDLAQSILGCADGPASFNAEMHLAGRTVVSCDPVYQYSAGEIRNQIEITSPKIISYASAHRSEFVWSKMIPNPDALAQHRMQAMERFLADFAVTQHSNRYVAAELPSLPFANDGFDLVLCSHFLFLYSEHLSTDFHVASIRELMRVATEARIFPLLELGGKRSRHLQAVTTSLQGEGYDVEFTTVDYEFQRGANQMMRILRPAE